MTRILPQLSGADRTAILADARSLVGTPFKHKGRDENGLDCVGFFVFLLSRRGHQCEDLADYSPNPDGVTLKEKVEAHLGPPVDVWRPGDLVLMRWHESKQRGVVYHNHVAMLGLAPYGGWTLIHSHRESARRRGTENRVKEHSLSGPWLRRVVSVHSLTGEA